MEALWQFLMDLSANHINPHGVYIPGGQYRFYFWSEIIAITAAMTALIIAIRSGTLTRIIARIKRMKAARDRYLERARLERAARMESMVVRTGFYETSDTVHWLKDAFEGRLHR